MKSGKVIDVSKSSLVSLKAELLRKQEEAQKSKGSETYIRPVAKKKKEPKSNPGVEERREKDEISQEEVDLLQKSREVLEVKSKLYDKLQKGKSVQENVGDPYLVDFKEKLDKVFSEEASTSKQTFENLEEDPTSHLSDPDDDDDWVDYVDCLGRSRRCLKEDLNAIKEKDEEMRKMLGNRPAPETSGEPSTVSDQPTERELEMISSDMQREMMRQKWEEQEQILMNKKNIYYEDIRFDEARTHGVAYYTFSTDENKREEEMAEFRLRREETMAKQKEAKQAKDRRDMMKQSRLMAARQRQRARLGLSPLPTDIEMEERKEENIVKDEISKEEEASTEELEAALTRAAHVRPWDVGKDGVLEKTKVMTQEEWIEKKREERPEEFAPPSLTEVAEINLPKKQKHKKRKGFNQPDVYDPKRKFEETPDDNELPGPWPQPNWNQATSSTQSTSFNIESPIQTSQTTFKKYKESSGTSSRGVAIPPPATFEYYNPSGSSQKKYSQPSKSTKDMIESIEAGLEFMRHQSEKREELLKKKGEIE